MLKSQENRLALVFATAVVFFIVVLGYSNVVTFGIMTLWEYLKAVVMALVSFAVLVVAVIWAVKGE